MPKPAWCRADLWPPLILTKKNGSFGDWPTGLSLRHNAQSDEYYGFKDREVEPVDYSRRQVRVYPDLGIVVKESRSGQNENEFFLWHLAMHLGIEDHLTRVLAASSDFNVIVHEYVDLEQDDQSARPEDDELGIEDLEDSLNYISVVRRTLTYDYGETMLFSEAAAWCEIVREIT